MSILPTTLLNDKPVPQHVLSSIAQAAAAKFPQWADNEHPDARAYNAYQLGALEYYLSTETVVPVAAEGYEQLRQVLTKYVACNEATQNEVFLRFRGGRSWTRAEFVQELRENGPQALDMMVSLMASTAYLLTQDKDFPVPDPTDVGKAAYAEKAAAFDQIDIIEEALRAASVERDNATTYALEEAVETSLPKIQRALVTLAQLAGDPTLANLGPTAALEPAAPAGKAPLAHREAARDLCYALRDLGPLDFGPADYTARRLILAAFAKLAPPAAGG